MVELGQTCKEILTGFEGVAVARTTNIVGVERISLISRVKGTKPGEGPEEFSFDVNQIEVIDKNQVLKPKVPPAAPFKFREKVRDPITGFEGRVVSRFIHINGCVKLGLQGEVTDNGKVPKVQFFEEPLLESIEPKETKEKLDDSKHRRTGGPGRSEAPRSF